MDKAQLLKERKENFYKAVNRQGAKWVPTESFNSTAALAYNNVTYWDVYRDFEKFPKVMGKVYEDGLEADVANSDRVMVTAKAGEIMRDCNQGRVTPDGQGQQFLQKTSMNGDEYPEVIKDPTAFMRNIMTPRRYPFLFEEDAHESAKTIVKLLNYMEEDAVGPLQHIEDYIEKNHAVFHFRDNLGLTTPGDIIFDNFRGFKGTLTDLRRNYDYMKEFCEVLWDKHFCLHFDEVPIKSDKYPSYMSHVPCFLNAKQYNELCFKYFKYQIEHIAAKGSKMYMLAEGAWSHLYDFFKDLPKDSVCMVVENDDIIETKKAIGDCQVLFGGAHMTDIRLRDEQWNIDNAKRVIDACAPGEGFVFATDKSWCCAGDITPNTFAVYKFAHEYTMKK